MGTFKAPLIAMLMATTTSAFAQSVSTSDNSVWRYLQSDEIIASDDWPALRDRVIDLWGAENVSEVPIGNGNMLNQTGLPATYRAASEAVEVIHLEGLPADQDVLVLLTEMLPDITLSDLDEFRDGVHLTALQMRPDSHEIGIFFLDRLEGDMPDSADQPIAETGSLSDIILARLENAGQLAEGFPPYALGNPNIFVSASLAEVTELVKNVLDQQGIAVSEVSMGEDAGTQFMGTNETQPTLISVAKADDAMSIITIIAQP
jgi:hypothetical protein